MAKARDHRPLKSRTARLHREAGTRRPKRPLPTRPGAECRPRVADRKWDNYFRHAVAKNVFAMLDNFASWLVIRMLRQRHRWRWKDVRQQFTDHTGHA